MMKHLTLRIKIFTGFSAVFFLFVVGSVGSIFNMNKISRIMEVSNSVNLLMRNMYHTRGIEKKFLLYKRQGLIDEMNDSVAELTGSVKVVGVRTQDESMRAKTDRIEQLVGKYHDEFRETAENIFRMDELKNLMKEASRVIFETLETKIKSRILEMQNDALITGEEINQVFNEILKVTNDLILELKDAWSYEKSFLLYNDPSFVEKFNGKIQVWNNVKKDLAYLIDTSGDAVMKDALTFTDKQFESYGAATMSLILALWEKNEEIGKLMEADGNEIDAVIREIQQEAQ